MIWLNMIQKENLQIHNRQIDISDANHLIKEIFRFIIVTYVLVNTP